MNTKNKIALALGSLLVVASAHAEGFDPTTATTQLSGAVTLAGTIVAGLVALGAGLMVYSKVRSFFSKAK